MEKKKQQTKTTKTKKKIDKSLKPVVIKTKGDPKQEGNPLNKKSMTLEDVAKRGYKPNIQEAREIKLPEGFKTADKITAKDDLEFENKKLRDMLTMWNFKLQFGGKMYYFLVDPMNQSLEMFDKNPMGNE